MSHQERPAPAAEGGPAAYLCFLLSLAAPGAGQVAGGARRRGIVWLGLAAGLAGLFTAGLIHLPTSGPFDGRDAAGLGAAVVLWLFGSYDAWFLVRERRNGMLQHLPRTPRVACLADLLWGGAGHAYLGLRAGVAMLLVTTAGAVGLALTGGWLAFAGLATWNVALALRSHSLAVRRYHLTPAYQACKDALDAAPVDSARAPSPSLPLLTLVAGLIAGMGGLLLQQTLADLAVPPTWRRAGQIRDGRFRDATGGLEMVLPGQDQGWLFEPGQPPLLLRGEQLDRGETFSVAVATAPLFGGQDRAPAGALARFATRQEEELAAQLTDFERLFRDVIDTPLPGVRLVFRSSARGQARLTAQQYLLAENQIIVLTLAGPISLGATVVRADLDALAAGLDITPPREK